MAPALTIAPVRYTGGATSRIPLPAQERASTSNSATDSLPAADAPKTGIACDDDISEERQRELDATLAAWDAESDHGERKGPFDPAYLDYEDPIRLKLTGADVFSLATCALIGTTPPEMDMVAELRGPNRRYGFGLSKLNLEGANLQKAQLTGACLPKAQLGGAN
jgi:hypothetical protein